MKRSLAPDDRDENKRPKSSGLCYVPKDLPINIREVSKEQFLRPDAAYEPNLLRSLLRLCARAKCINNSAELVKCYADLEQISASRRPDIAKIKDIQERLAAMGITLNVFVPREKTDKDYEVYLAETAEEKMNIRKLLRLT